MPNETTPQPLTSIPVDSFGAMTQGEAGAPIKIEPDPDNPPWNVLTAFLTWLASVGMLFGTSMISLVFIMIYVVSTYGSLSQQQLRGILTTDKTAVLLQVIAVIPAHLLTLGVAWWVVTDMGKRPFWRLLGWSWNRGIGLWTSTAVAVSLLLFGGLLTRYYEGEPTDIDQIINSSTAARLVLAFLATATAPLVEEIIYRGILYPALQRTIGVAWAVVGVTILFMGVHVVQYYNNISVIATIGILSLTLTLVRAYTGRLLPCFVIHLVFNGLQSLYIVFQPYISQPVGTPEQKQAIVEFIVRSACALL